MLRPSGWSRNWRIGKLAWPCTAASLAMSAVLLGLRNSGLMPTLIAAGAVYLLVLSLLLPFAHGYFRRSPRASAEGAAAAMSPVDVRTPEGEMVAVHPPGKRHPENVRADPCAESLA